MTLETAGDPSWYKDAIIYEIHVRAFRDSDGDGIGDFRGLTEKLDYLQELGVTALWLLPFYPSPLKDDGYDIADYRSVNPIYGKMRDFRTFLKEANRRGLHVITELAVNHTSDQHEWFQRARRSPENSSNRDFYVWSDSPDKYSETRIIFQDTETSNWAWDPVARSYFWHRFYSHQPDLNYDNPRVRRAVKDVLDFWMKMGVSGMRLDAIPYLFEREDTNCENLPETHEYIKELRAHVDSKFPGRMLLSEANQWPEDAVEYFGDGDETHMAFHFPLMPRLFMALRMEDSSPVIDILEQTPPIPDAAQWAIFLRNHDELTLEMVTDEERDYMYRMYAYDRNMRINLGIRRRLAPLLNNDRRKVELMNALLFSLPGTPVMYYGDEIGMGDNFYLGDRDAVRTPMQWNSDRNAGFSSANSQRLYLPVVVDPEYHFEAINVETQQQNPDSLLWWMKRIIALRKRYAAFGRGSLEFLRTSNVKVLAYIRKHGDEEILVVANFSRYPQHVQIEGDQIRGKVPVELFGAGEFPPCGDSPYSLSVGAYGFYWFQLKPEVTAFEADEQPHEAPSITLRTRTWGSLFADRPSAAMIESITDFLRTRRWFSGKARRIRNVSLQHVVPVTVDGGTVHALFVEVTYSDGEPDLYFIPVALATDSVDVETDEAVAQAAICKISFGSGAKTVEGTMYDALVLPQFSAAVLRSIGTRGSFKNRQNVTLNGVSARSFRRLRSGLDSNAKARILSAEQSNTSVVFDNQLLIKFYRRIHPGINPDVEIGRFLTEQVKFPNTAEVGGTLELVTSARAQGSTVAVLQEFVESRGDAWEYTLDMLRNYSERGAAEWSAGEAPVPKVARLTDLAEQDVPHEVSDVIGPYLGSSLLLGQRTAEMHLALSSSTSADFAVEPFTRLYQRSLYQGMRSSVRAGLRQLRTRLASLPEQVAPQATALVNSEGVLLERLAGLLDHRISAGRIRIHGDYHLGQVLNTGTDFTIIDFEGEPLRPLSERRLKRSPLRDVAGMVRSFHYASSIALFDGIDPNTMSELWSEREQAAELWYQWVAASFLGGYRETLGKSELMPVEGDDFNLLLDCFLIQKAVYEIEYELNNRPLWTHVPIKGLLSLVNAL